MDMDLIVELIFNLGGSTKYCRNLKSNSSCLNLKHFTLSLMPNELSSYKLNNSSKTIGYALKSCYFPILKHVAIQGNCSEIFTKHSILLKLIPSPSTPQHNKGKKTLRRRTRWLQWASIRIFFYRYALTRRTRSLQTNCRGNRPEESFFFQNWLIEQEITSFITK